MKKVIVIGAGIGGLCVAIRLLNKGYDVTILEKEDTIGGKVNIKTKEGARFDLTASVLMTPESYINIFSEVGKDYRDYFEMIKIDPIYKVNYYDKNNYKFYSDLGKMTDTLEKIEKGLSVQYMEFLYKSFKKYINSKKYFLDEPMINKKEILKLKPIKKLLESNPLMTTDSYLSSIIKNENLLNYLIYQSMYIGVDPYKNSSLYTLIPAISHIYGLWYIKGGFYNYIEALKKLILELGGNIYVNTEVEKILTDKIGVKGVKTNKGNYKSDIVVCNADYPYAVKNLIKNKDSKNINKQNYSCSAFMMYLGLSKEYKDLEVHNLYLGEDFKQKAMILLLHKSAYVTYKLDAIRYSKLGAYSCSCFLAILKVVYIYGIMQYLNLTAVIRLFTKGIFSGKIGGSNLQVNISLIKEPTKYMGNLSGYTATIT